MNVFQHHDRSFENNRYVYPVISRRSRGASIGIDLTHERCTFRCVYCSELAKREGDPVTQEELSASADADKGAHPQALARPAAMDVLESELKSALGLALSGQLFQLAQFRETPPAFRRLNDIALSGSGEPTLSPSFAEVCRLIRRLGDAARGSGEWPAPKAVLITNATALHLPRVQRGLEALGPEMAEIWAKLDAGTEAHYLSMNRARVPFSLVLDNLLAEGRRRPLFIQSMFGVLEGEPPQPAEIGAWIGRLRDLKAGGAAIRGVQVYTSARSSRGGPFQPLPDEALRDIAGRVRDEAGLPAAWYGASGGMGEA